MNRLDEELRQALRREEPPAGFAERVARYAEGRRLLQQHRTTEARTDRGRWPFMRWAAAAALVGAIAGGVQYRDIVRQREERVRGEAASQQVVEALRIAGSKLHAVQELIKEMGS